MIAEDYIPLLVCMRHIQIGTIQTSEMDIPFLASLQVVWNGVQLLLGHQTGSEERRRKYTLTTPTKRRRTIIVYDVDIQRRYDRIM